MDHDVESMNPSFLLLLYLTSSFNFKAILFDLIRGNHLSKGNYIYKVLHI